MSLDAATVEATVRKYADQAKDAGLDLDVASILAEMGIEAPKGNLTVSVTIPANPNGESDTSYVKAYVIEHYYTLLDSAVVTEVPAA